MSATFYRALARRAAQRYRPAGPFARHFAYGKLTGDPVFRAVLERGLIPGEPRVLDLGCGQGLLGTLLDTARERADAGDWPERWPAPPRPRRTHGVELARRQVERACAAAGERARYVVGDIRTAPFEESDAVVLLDVLHYLDYAAQDAVLDRALAALAPGGVLLVRVADASGSLRFRATLALDRLATRLRGQRFERLYCRPLPSWIERLRRAGLDAEALPMSRGTPFANVLLVARRNPLRAAGTTL